MTARTEPQPLDGDRAASDGIRAAQVACRALVDAQSSPLEAVIGIAAAAGYAQRAHEIARGRTDAHGQQVLDDAHAAGRAFAERAYEEARRRRNTG